MNIHIILPIVIVIAIIYYYHIHQEEPLREGLSNEIKKVTNAVKKVSNDVKKVTSSIKTIENMFKCPINLFSNLHICARFYAFDFIFFCIWAFVYLNMYILLYLPIKLVSLFMCLVSSKSLCFTINPSDICISKRSFFSAIEQPFYTITGKNFLNRTSKDIDRCYCIPYPPLIPSFIKDAIRPLTGFQSIEKKFSIMSTALGGLYIGVPIIVMGFIYFVSNFSNNGDDQTGGLPIDDITYDMDMDMDFDTNNMVDT
jgi:hypothetical protein